MRYFGPLAKMRSLFYEPIQYYLTLNSDFVQVNSLIGREIGISFSGEITCFCGNEVTEVYRKNFCRDCFFTKPEASLTIMKPELSKAHLGIEERDLEVEKKLQLQPHVVYLANSAGLKVGVTRESQVPTRWIDQGAEEAIVLAKTTNRYEAGVIEVFLKDYFSDKTPWQKMVQGYVPSVNLIEEKQKAIKLLPEELSKWVDNTDEVMKLKFPVEEYPTKVKSINLSKTPEFKGVLKGIRGQYLLFEGGGVLNVRSHEGYRVTLEV